MPRIPKVSGLVILLSASLVSTQAADGVASPGAHDPAALKVPNVPGPEIWKDPSQPIAARVKDLVRRLSLAEKVSQISCDTAALPRLGIPAYSHRNECLHGVRNGITTVFPQAIGMAATWDAPLIHEEAGVIATEARAKHNDYAAKHHGNSIHKFGLSYYTPNINLVRDSRWGRGQGTYGEDPFLTAQIAVAFIRGLQGNNPRYLKIMACAKHFAVHSGPEPERHRLDARPPRRDLYETYLPAFEAAVRQGHVGSVMGAYSSLYGVPDCANHFLLTDLLRKQWGFNGFVVSDGGAIWDIWAQHKYAATPEAAAAAAVKAGCDICSGNVNPSPALLRRAASWTGGGRGWLRGGEDFRFLTRAVHDGLISETQIDEAVAHELEARFRLGMFDPPFKDYSMANRTYRYFDGKPLFAFGYGLSYTKFDYSRAKLGAASLDPKGTVKLSFTLKNNGSRDGDEVAQVYFRHVHSAVPQPRLALCDFTRIHLARGESRTVTMNIPAKRFRYWSTKEKHYVVEPGKYQLLVGAASDDIRLRLPFVVENYRMSALAARQQEPGSARAWRSPM